MTTETFNLPTVLARAPFTLPNVRSSFKGNVVHIGVLVQDFRLRAACHAQTNAITTAEPTGDTVSCSNCLSRERQGLIPHSAGVVLRPALARSALTIWRNALGSLRADVNAYELRRFHAMVGGTPDDWPALPKIAAALAVELIEAFTLYDEVKDEPVVTALVKEIAEKMRLAVFPAADENPAAA